MIPLFKNPAAESPRDSIILQATRGIAICSGDWKLTFCPGSGCEDRWLISTGQEQAWREAVEAYGKDVRNHQELCQPAFVQLFNLADDPSETTDISSDHPDKVRELYDLFQSQVNSGRSTPGTPQKNDRAAIKAFQAVPAFVWEKREAKPIR